MGKVIKMEATRFTKIPKGNYNKRGFIGRVINLINKISRRENKKP